MYVKKEKVNEQSCKVTNGNVIDFVNINLIQYGDSLKIF